MAVERQVAIRYALEYTDKGMARAVAATRQLEQASGKTGAAVTLAARRSQDAWRLLDRDARKFDSDTTRRALSQSTAVSRSVQTQVGSLRKLGASYSEIERMMRTYGATAQQTSAAIRRSYDSEASAAEAAVRRQEAALKRAAAARQTLKSLPGNVLGLGGGGGISKGEERSFVRGTVRGAVNRGGSFIGGGLVGGLAGLVSVEGIKSAIESTKALAKETQYLSQVTGMSNKTAAEWAAIADSRGINAQALNVALRTLSKTSEQAQQNTGKAVQASSAHLSAQVEAALHGSKSTIGAFQALGITYDDVTRRQHKVADITGLVEQRLAKMRDGAQKTTIQNQLLGKSAGGVAATADAYKQLGITQQDLAKHSHDVSGLLGLVADRLNRMHGGTQKAAIEAKLFGRNAAALQPILQEGSKGIEEMRKQASAYGVTLGSDPLKNSHKLEEASYNLKLAQIGLSVQFSEHVAPALIKVTSGGIKLARAVGHELQPAFKALSPAVKDVGHWLGENKGIVLGVVGAFAALKIVRTVGGWFGGLYNDAKKVVGFGRGIVDMFRGQAAAADTDAAAMDRLAASLERVALVQREMGSGGMPGIVPGVPGGRPGVGRWAPEEGPVVRRRPGVGRWAPEEGPVVRRRPGVGTAEADAAATVEKGLAGGGASEEKLAQTVMQNSSQGGILQAFFGRTGLTSLGNKLGVGGKAATLTGDAAKVAGAGEVAGVAGDAEKAVGLLGKFGPALGGFARFAGPIGGAITAFQAADAFITTHGTLGERLSSTMHSLTFGLIGNDPTNVQQRAQGLKRANVSFGGFQADSRGLLTSKGLAQDTARQAQLQQQLYALQHPAAVQTARGGTVPGTVDEKVVLDREAQIKQLNRLTVAEQNAALATVKVSNAQAQGASKWSNVQAQIKAITPGLDKLTGKWQDAGALSAVQYAAGLEKQGRLPLGATDKLIQQLERRYPALTAYLQQQGGQSMQALADQFRVNRVQSSAINLIGDIHKTFGFLPTYAKTAGDSTQAKMRTTMGELQHIIKTGTAAQRAAAEPELKKLQGLYGTYMDALKTRTQHDTDAARKAIEALGGNWSNLGSVFKTVTDQQIIPSLNGVLGGINNILGTNFGVSATGGNVAVTGNPRHGGHFAHGGWVVPGDPTRDGTLAMLSGNEVVLTGPGQQQMESQAPGLLDHIVATQAPHFGGGGYVAGQGGWNAASSGTGHKGHKGHKPPPQHEHWDPFENRYRPMTSQESSALRDRYIRQHGHAPPSGPGKVSSGSPELRRLDTPARKSIRDLVELAIYGGFSGRNITTAASVAMAESGGSPGSTNYNSNGTTDYGLWQINSVNHPVRNWADPLANARNAFQEWVSARWRRDPWDDWTTYAKGANRPYLGSAAAALRGISPALAQELRSGKGGGGAGVRFPSSYQTTSFVPVSRGLTGDAFDLGYNYALDPTADGATTPGSALRQAILGASLKAVRRTVKIPAVASHTAAKRARAVAGGAYTLAGGVPGHPELQSNISRIAETVLARYPGLQVSSTTGGKHASGSYHYRGMAVDLASGNYPYMRQAAGWIESTGLYRRLLEGIHNPNLSVKNGGNVSPGFWGSSTWGGHLNHIHLAARRGGRLQAGRFRTGGRATPSLRIAAGGRPALPALPSSLGYNQIGSLQDDLALIPTTAVNIGVRTARGALAGLNRALHTIQTTPNDARIRQAMGSLSGLIGNVAAVSYATLQRTQTALQHGLMNLTTRAVKHTRTITEHSMEWGRPHAIERQQTYFTRVPRKMTGGQQHEETRLKQALALVDYQMGQRTGTLVRVAENESAALSGAQTRLQRLMDRKGIDQASAQGASMLEAFDAQSVKVLKDTVGKLQHAYQMAKKAGDKKALADIGGKLTDALDNLDQAVTDRIVAHRNMVEAAAQGASDRAAHGSTLAQTAEQTLQLQQQISGSYGTPAGGKQLSSYITATVVPALQVELQALKAQQAAAASVGDQQTADQIGEAVAGKLNDVLQAQLDAQTAIKDATQQTAQNTQPVSGTLGVSYQGQALPNLASMLAGA